MSDTKHTPGPWSRKYIYGALRHIERNVDRGAYLDPDEDARIDAGEVNVPGCRYNPADVDLIAAAPDLLAACERIAAIENRLVGGDWDEIEEARHIARAAIRKAKGGGL